jgi:hypothetical protein
MHAHRSLLFVVGLSLAGCAGTPAHDTASRAAWHDGKLTVHVVEASGGA